MFTQVITLTLKTHERTRLFRHEARGLARTFELQFKPLNTTDELKGSLEIQRKLSIFHPENSETLELENSMTLEASWSDNVYSVFVEPEVDLTVSIRLPQIALTILVVIFICMAVGWSAFLLIYLLR